jgi:hypothetical protein
MTPPMYVNLTPRDVTLFDGEVAILTIPATGQVARISELVHWPTSGPLGGGVDGVTVVLGAIEDLPEPEDGVTYIVSMPTMMGLRASGNARTDVRYPYEQVRDSRGRIIGCRSLAILPPPEPPRSIAVETYGPQGEYIAALIKRAELLTGTEVVDLAQAANWDKAARDAAWDAAYGAAQGAVRLVAWITTWDSHEWGNAWFHAWNAGRDDVPGDTAWKAAAGVATGAVHGAARIAAVALLVRDLISPDGFTQEHYDILTGPWRRIIGPIHPDDDELEVTR